MNMSFDISSKNKNSCGRGHILEAKYLTAEDEKPT